MKGVDAVARILQQEGVEFLFSYPNNNLIDSAAAIGIRPIIARTEKTLLNMTDGFSRATNGKRLGVCVVQGGPGIENAYGGMAQAYADSIPLLLMPGGGDQRNAYGPAEFDPLPTYEHASKWASRIVAANRIPEFMRRAFSMLRTNPTGPVLLELPRDVAAADVDEASLNYTPARGNRAMGDPERVAEAVQVLLNAKRPLLHVGHGVLWAEAWDELREFAELVQAPVATTMAGKSAFPEDHPLSVGTCSSTTTRAAAVALKGADVVFGIGCSFAKSNFAATIPDGKTIVHITANPNDIDKNYPSAVSVLGDAKLVLRQLIDEVKKQTGDGGRAQDDALLAAIREAKEAGAQEWQARRTSDETPINPYRVMWDLMHTVDRKNTMITHDSGNPRDQLLTTWEALIPRGYLGWGKSTQLGTGLGVALGAKLACPDRLVINVMGDLAFGTAGLEVETGVRERIPIMTVLINNSRMGGYGHHMPAASERYGANRLSGQYSAMAASLGAYSERIEQPGEVVAAIQRGIKATEAGQPVVLEFITKEEPVYPRTSAVLESLG
jgi:acetolactate synthase-1/2/3 large subunit